MALSPENLVIVRQHLQAAAVTFTQLAALDFTALLSELTDEQVVDVVALLDELAALRIEAMRKAPKYKEIVGEVVFNTDYTSAAWKAYQMVLRQLAIVCGLSTYLGGAYGFASRCRRPDLF